MARPSPGEGRRTLPGFPAGSDTTVSGAVLQKICLLVAVAILPAALADWASANYPALAVLGFQETAVVAAFVANRWSRTSLAKAILCYSALMSACLFISVSTLGFHDTAALMYPMILIIAAMLLRERRFRVFAAAVAGTILVVELLQWLRLTRATAPRDLAVVDVAVITTVTGVVSATLIAQLRRSLDRARQYGTALQSLVTMGSDHPEHFFVAAATELARLLGVRCVVLGAFPVDDPASVRTLAIVVEGSVVANQEFSGAEFPAGNFPSGFLQRICADARDCVRTPLLNTAGSEIGFLAILDTSPIALDKVGEALLSIFATSAAGALALRRETEALLESEDRFRRLVESDVVGIIVADDTRIREASDHFLSMVGYSRADLVAGSLTWEAITSPEHRAACGSAFESLRGTGACPAFEQHFERKQGGSIPVLMGGIATRREPLNLIGFVVDLTRQKSLEQQFQQAQKLESLGLLAGGIAHDFNNLLTVISGYGGMLQAHLGTGTRDWELAGRIVETSESASKLTQQLLAFSRMHAAKPARVRVNAIVSDSLRMMGRLLGETMRLETALDASPDAVNADPTQIQQCLLNLVLNARDAMAGGGKVMIRTANEQGRRGPVVVISVEDDGTGMDQATVSHIFEPFFTTKLPGQGTGLGLSTVYGIVQRWGGELSVESEIGEGSTFTIRLPQAEGIDETGTPPVAEAMASRNRGTETILVVEDRDDVREFVVQALEDEGYRILQASGGCEALEILRAGNQSLDLVLTDIVMHGMRGTELARQAKELFPSLEVLFMSGHAAELASAEVAASMRVVQKPFTPDQLVASVRESLACRKS